MGGDWGFAKSLKYLVVLAVSSKPLSSWHFPANREFNREILRFCPSLTHGAAQHAAQFAALSSSWRTIGAQKEQGIFSRHQGIEIPCYGFEQRKFVSFL
jgi:hypothetical protein